MDGKNNVVPLFGAADAHERTAEQEEVAIEEVVTEISLLVDSTGEVVGITTEHLPDDTLLSELLASVSRSSTVGIFDAARSDTSEFDGGEFFTLVLDDDEWWEE